MVAESRVHRVPGRVGSGRNHGAILTEDAIHQARFSYVGPAHHGDPDHPVLIVRTRLLDAGQGRGQPVEQVARALSRQRAHACGFAQAEAPEHLVGLVAREIVQLVGDQNHFAFRRAHQLGQFLVERVGSGLGVHHEEQEIGFPDGRESLAAHGPFDLPVAPLHDAAGIGEQEAVPRPVGAGEDAVSGYTGSVVHDGLARKRLKRVDLPTLGRPTIATVGRRAISLPPLGPFAPALALQRAWPGGEPPVRGLVRRVGRAPVRAVWRAPVRALGRVPVRAVWRAPVRALGRPPVRGRRTYGGP